MSLLLIILVLLIGLGCLFAEFFLFPGLTVAGILGALCLLAGVYLGYSTFGATTGHLIFFISLAAASLVFWRGVKRLGSAEYAVLESLDGRVGERESMVNVGDQGQSVSDLRPGGTAMIAGHRMEVFSQGEFIPSQRALRVVRLTDQRVYVVEQQPDSPSASPEPSNDLVDTSDTSDLADPPSKPA
jgi:membrane-bound ClpP family serine protease